MNIILSDPSILRFLEACPCCPRPSSVAGQEALKGHVTMLVIGKSSPLIIASCLASENLTACSVPLRCPPKVILAHTDMSFELGAFACTWSAYVFVCVCV